LYPDLARAVFPGQREANREREEKYSGYLEFLTVKSIIFSFSQSVHTLRGFAARYDFLDAVGSIPCHRAAIIDKLILSDEKISGSSQKTRKISLRRCLLAR